METLGKHISAPVLPHNEALDYLPTQMIAEYLAEKHESKLDGIIFESVQHEGGKNVVLFHHSSLVKPLVYPEGAEVDVRISGHADEDDFTIESYDVGTELSECPEVGVIEKNEKIHYPIATNEVQKRCAENAYTLNMLVDETFVREVSGIEYVDVEIRVDRYSVNLKKFDQIHQERIKALGKLKI